MEVPNITIATSVRYGTYKRHFDEALWVVEKIVYNFEKLKKHFNLPENLQFHIRPIRYELGKAYFYREKKQTFYVIEVDMRTEEEEFYDTILHELTHIEQFYEQRLQQSKTPGAFRWLGKRMWFVGMPIEEYNALPWELEAIQKASKLKKLVFD